MNNICQECGMVCAPAEYHPYAACLMFNGCHDSDKVRANLAAISAQAQASEAEDAPEGWQLVPVEPTQEVMDADWNVTLSDAHTDGG